MLLLSNNVVVSVEQYYRLEVLKVRNSLTSMCVIACHNSFHDVEFAKLIIIFDLNLFF